MIGMHPFGSDPLASHLSDMVRLSRDLKGYLSDREVQFLALTAALLPPSLGEVLEIGSSRGKSTTILAKSVRMAGGRRVVAVDPLAGATKLNAFCSTLEANGLQDMVELHRMKSQDLAATWDRPIRLLWIDGDHTYKGALGDFDRFSRFCSPGSIVAFHDVLHGFEGPIRAFCEGVLLSDVYGPCGVCGSIGWSQRLSSSGASHPYIPQKLRLYRKLSRLIPHVALGRSPRVSSRAVWSICRSLVPHGELRPDSWVAEIGKNLATSMPADRGSVVEPEIPTSHENGPRERANSL